jgi:hypothetical protein
MNQTTEDLQTRALSQPSTPATFREVLESFAGKVVTIVNPESLEDAPVGRRLSAGFYRGKVLSIENDYLVLATEYVHRRGDKGKEPVRQFVPMHQIKRVSVMRSERMIHL